MSYTVVFIGLVNFFRDAEKGPVSRLALLPDGRVPGGSIAPHRATFAIATEDVVRADWWPDTERNRVRSFPVRKKATISITGLDDPAGPHPLNTSLHDGRLPRLQDLNVNFNIVPSKAATIIQMPILQGRLEARLFRQDAIVTQLSVDNGPGDVTITARTNDGRVRTLTVKDRTEIVVFNVSDPAAPEPTTEEGKHFHIYRKLDVRRRDIPGEPPQQQNVDPLVTNHPAITNFGTFPGIQCSNTGCCQ